MKFSLNLAQYFAGDLSFKSIDTTELINKMGLQLGSIETYTTYAERYKNICVVKVISCEKHPNADKLHVCLIDDGGINQHVDRDKNGLIQVVCGAPNVHADMYVAWIPPQATVPSTFATDPFVLEAREIRGVLSNGMLASPKELDINDEHDGILEILADDIGHEPVAGEPIESLYGLDDVVVTCENKMFTHRPDCFGNLGIAREVAGIFGNEFKSPDWYWQVPTFDHDSSLPLKTMNEVSELVPRFMCVVMQDVTVKPSPIWMQAYLRRVGIKPINNVVDVTNYVMHLTGQPTHAFDYDKLLTYSHEATLFPRKATKGETLMLLGNKEVTLTGEEIVIATDKQAVALAGIMGGAETEVDENTKSIVIECATFDMYNIRRTSMRYGLFTEAVTRFNKGQSPLQNDRVLSFVMKNMQDLAGARQASSVSDLRSFDQRIYDSQVLNDELIIHPTFIQDRLGVELSSDDIAKLLHNVEFAVTTDEDGRMKISAPFWRTDISLAEDIVEEVGRLYGYDKLPAVLPRRSSKPNPRNKMMEFVSSLRRTLKESGANEVLTYSFLHGDLLKHAGIDADTWTYHLRNAISPDLQYYRPSILPSLLAKVHSNAKAQAGTDDNEFALYEFGKAHVKGEFETDEPHLPKQMRRLALVYSSDEKTQKRYAGSPYYQAKCYLDAITNGCATYLPLDTNEYPLTAPFIIGRSAVVMIQDQMLGVIGELRHSVKKALKLPAFTAGFELDLDLLQAHLQKPAYKPLSVFPSVEQDITLEVSEKTTWQQLDTLLRAELEVADAETGLASIIRPIDIYQEESSDKRRYSFRITVSHAKKTLKTVEVNALLDQLAKAAYETLDANRI